MDSSHQNQLAREAPNEASKSAQLQVLLQIKIIPIDKCTIEEQTFHYKMLLSSHFDSFFFHTV